jgi:hypothetical protein
MNNLLSKIHKGMTVYDQSQNEIGTVEYVQFGDEDPLRPIPRAATPGRTDERGDWLVESVLDVFGPDDLPDMLRERLLLYGFIRVDAPGLFAADRYIFPNQIQSVDGSRVTLNVSKNELVQNSRATRPQDNWR